MTKPDQSCIPKDFYDMNETELEAWISARFIKEYQALSQMKASFDAHQELLAKNSSENAELLEIFRSAKSLIKLGNGLAAIFVWVTKAALFLGVLWAIWKFMVLEAIKAASSGVKS